MFLGYNTNGFAHHDLFDALTLLADLGYRGVGVTIDHHALSPRNPHWERHCDRLGELLDRFDMRSVVETGARFLLDPRVKHEPTLISPDATDRFAFYDHAIRCAARLGSDCVSIWSGVIRDDVTEAAAWDRLVERLPRVLDSAAAAGIPVAFEPEPGMLVDATARFGELVDRLAGREDLKLTIDVGHLHCSGEPLDVIAAWADRLVNVHIEDMVQGRHEHLAIGEGEVDFPPVFEALRAAGYEGGVYVELSRDSHRAPEVAAAAIRSLRDIG